MTVVAYIKPPESEIKEIFIEGLGALDRALELFMMIEKHHPMGKEMVRKTYELFKLGEGDDDERPA